MESVRNTYVSSYKDSQRTVISYNRIRRNEEWETIYYDLFETVKDSQPSFEQIIRNLYKNTGNIGASLSSKMHSRSARSDASVAYDFSRHTKWENV